MPGELVDPATYDEKYNAELKKGVPFLGEAMTKDALFSSLVVLVVVTLAAVIGPKGHTGLPEPTLTGANPRPDWPFLWLFGLLSLSPPRTRDIRHARLPDRSRDRVAACPVHLQPRGAGSEPASDSRVVGGPRRNDAGSPYLRRRDRPVVACHGSVERRPGATGHREAVQPPGIAGGSGVPEQELP